MDLSKDTTFESLYKANKISKRTYNCARKNNLFTLGQIQERFPDRTILLDLPLFGGTSYREIDDLMRMLDYLQEGKTAESRIQLFESLDEQSRSILQSAYDKIVNDDGVIASDLKTRFPSVAELHYMVLTCVSDLIAINHELSMRQNMEIRKRLIFFVSNVHTLKLNESVNHFVCELYLDRLSDLQSDPLLIPYIDIYNYFMTPMQRKLVDIAYHELFDSVQSGWFKRILRNHIEGVESYIRLFNAPYEEYVNLCGGRSYKGTLERIMQTNDHFRRKFEHITFEQDHSLAKIDISKQFPFLSPLQQSFVLDFQNEHGGLPLLFLIYHYLLASEIQSDLFYVKRKGLVDPPLSISEIAEQVGLSFERVRQVLVAGPSVYQEEFVRQADLSLYRSIIELPYLMYDDPVLLDMISREDLSINYVSFSALLNILVPFSAGSVNGVGFIINRQLLPHLDIAALESKLNSLVYGAYTTEVEIPIQDCLPNLEGEEKQHALALAELILKRAYAVSLNEHKEFIISKNKIDLRLEITNILKESGKPLSLDEILSRFRALYPKETVEVAQIKSSIRRSNNIKALGLSKLYGLNSWENVYFGTIRDCVKEQLQASDVPMSITDLFVVVQKVFPQTNMHSLLSNITDNKELFIRYGEQIFGLAGKHYPDQYKPYQKDPNKLFNDLMQDLRDFVESHRRLPFLYGTPRERHLRQSMYKVETNRFRCVTTEQRAEFMAYLDKCKAAGYELSKTESLFRDKCELLISFVERMNRLPKESDGEDINETKYQIQYGYDTLSMLSKRHASTVIDCVKSHGIDWKIVRKHN